MSDKLAYPVPAVPTHSPGQPGLTRRELFAAMAMQGILASEGSFGTGEGDIQALRRRAEWAADQADALIAQLDAL